MEEVEKLLGFFSPQIIRVQFHDTTVFSGIKTLIFFQRGRLWKEGISPPPQQKIVEGKTYGKNYFLKSYDIKDFLSQLFHFPFYRFSTFSVTPTVVCAIHLCSLTVSHSFIHFFSTEERQTLILLVPST